MTQLESGTNKGTAAKHTELIKQSVLDTFAMICGEEPGFEGLAEVNGPCDCVIAVISILGLKAWTVMLSLPRETAPALTMGFTGFEIPYDSPDMGDMVGELANILAGDIVAKFEGIGIKCEMSLPTIIRGSDVKLLRPENSLAVQLKFSSSKGPFHLDLITGEPPNYLLRRAGA